MKLTLTPEVKAQVDAILGPLKNPEAWAAFGLPFSKSPSAVVLLRGAPGTGKTSLCEHMARKLGRNPIHINFANVASDVLGQTEKNIVDAFARASETETHTVFLEECESLLWTRDMVDKDTTYMLGFVDTLLQEIDKFIARPQPSLLLLTTNYPQLIDSAIESRITDYVDLASPVGIHARQMWKSKLPVGVKLSDADLDYLGELKATPRQMEQAVLRVCRQAILQNRQPTAEDFINPA